VFDTFDTAPVIDLEFAASAAAAGEVADDRLRAARRCIAAAG
jgi:hypothetical protein